MRKRLEGQLHIDQDGTLLRCDWRKRNESQANPRNLQQKYEAFEKDKSKSNKCGQVMHRNSFDVVKPLSTFNHSFLFICGLRKT